MHFRHRLIHLHTRSTQDTSLRHRKQFHWSEEDYHQSARKSRPGRYSNSIGSFMSQEMSEWEMIPPRSPQFGGLWEAVVKSMKHHLRRIVGVQIRSLEELNILVIQIEGFQISQPLSAMSSDPNHLQLITPAQFFGANPQESYLRPVILMINFISDKDSNYLKNRRGHLGRHGIVIT